MVGREELGAFEIKLYPDAVDVEAGSSCTATPVNPTALLPSLFRDMLWVEQLTSLLVADGLSAMCFFGEPPIRCVSTCSCSEHFAGCVGRAAGSVSSE